MRTGIEIAPGRLVDRSRGTSWPFGIALLALLGAWVAASVRELPRAWASGAWPSVALGSGGIVAASAVAGGMALLALGHQRLTMSAAGLENAWIALVPIRRRSVPAAEILAIDVVTEEAGDGAFTYLRVRTRRGVVNWSLFVDHEDGGPFRDGLRALIEGTRRGRGGPSSR